MLHNKYTTRGLKKGGKDLDPLGKYLGGEVGTAKGARDGLKKRWELNEQVYRNDPKIAGVKLFDNYAPRATAPMSPRINRIINTTATAIFSPSPMVQAIPDDQDQVGADTLEKALHLTWIRAGFPRKARSALLTTALCGVSIMRLRMTPKGLKFDYIHPNDFVIAPTFLDGIPDAHLVGHRFYLPKWEVIARTKPDADGKILYPLMDEEGVRKMSSADPDDEPSGRDPSYDRSTNEESGVFENQRVELWELIVRIEVDKKPQYKRVVLSHDDAKLLLVEEYIYSRPWYFDLRFHDEPGKFYPASSVAQNIVGLALLKQDMTNLLATGSMATAANPVVISGMGSLGKKLKHYNIGMIIEVPYDVQVQEIPISFNPGAMPAVMDIIDNNMESQTGITDQRLAAERASGDITATQISAEEQAARQNEGAYPSFAADLIEPIAYFWQELLTLHPKDFRRFYGTAIQEEVYGLARNSVRWVMTGKNSGNSPHILIGKLQSMLTMASQPGSTLDYGKVESAVISALQLPMDVEKLKKTDEQIAQERDQEMALAQLEAQGQAPPGGNGGVDGGLGPQAGVGVPEGPA